MIGGAIDEAAALHEMVGRAYGGRLVLDLAGVTFINSLGVRDWIRMQSAAQQAGLAVELRRVAEPLVHQLNMIALPRRFSLPMQEIWLLQSRFSQRQRKRVFRLLAHPRFRAAFDFLNLRLAASDEHAEDVAFWREAQGQSGDALAAQLESQQGEPAEGEGDGEAPRKRRRRRRKPAAPGE